MLLRGNLRIDLMKLPDIITAIIGRQAHAQQQHLRALFPAGADEMREVVPHLGEIDAAKAIVSTQSDDNDGGPVLWQRRVQNINGRACRLAADAQIDHPESIGSGLQALIQQVDPALLRIDPVGRTETIAHDQDHRWLIGAWTANRQA